MSNKEFQTKLDLQNPFCVAKKMEVEFKKRIEEDTRKRELRKSTLSENVKLLEQELNKYYTSENFSFILEHYSDFEDPTLEIFYKYERFCKVTCHISPQCNMYYQIIKPNGGSKRLYAMENLMQEIAKLAAYEIIREVKE